MLVLAREALGVEHLAMTQAELQKMRDWADAKIAGGQEPPWAWYQYMKLRETLDRLRIAQISAIVSPVAPVLILS